MDYREWGNPPAVTNLVDNRILHPASVSLDPSILRPTSLTPPRSNLINYWDSGFINGQHPDMESDDDIGPVAVVLGAAVVTLGAMTVVASIVALLVAAIRKIFGR